MYTYTKVHTFVYSYKLTEVYIFMYTSVCIYIHIRLRTHVHAFIHIFANLDAAASHESNVQIYVHTYTHFS